MNEWRPIETAPKDGTCFIGARRGWGKRSGDWIICVMRGNRKHMRFEPYPFTDSFRQPTHWMPLPEPPAMTGEKP